MVIMEPLGEEVVSVVVINVTVINKE